MQIESNILHARLQNCLLTIVELEPALSRLTIHTELIGEFKQLKSILSKIPQLEVSLEEVDRIERATRIFLKEMEVPFSKLKFQSRHPLH